MIRIQQSGTFEGMSEATTGDGVAAKVGKVLQLSSGYLTGTAEMTHRVYALPGETITISCLCRLVSGTRARMKINWPTAGAPKNQIYIESGSWEKKTLKFAVPHTHDPVSDVLNVVLSSNNEDDGLIEFAELVIESDGAGLSTPRMIACGKIKMLAGIPSIDDNYASFGIKSLSYDGSLLQVYTDYTFPINNGQIPIAIATKDGQLLRQVDIGATMDRFGLGRVYVAFSDSSSPTGAIVNLTTPATYPELNFNLIVMM